MGFKCGSFFGRAARYGGLVGRGIVGLWVAEKATAEFWS